MAKQGEAGQNKNTFARSLEVQLANRKTADDLIGELSKQDGRLSIVAVFIGTSISTTTDFGDVLTDDVIMSILDADQTVEIAVADGTKPSAAVVGAAYQIMRTVPTITE